MILWNRWSAVWNGEVRLAEALKFLLLTYSKAGWIRQNSLDTIFTILQCYRGTYTLDVSYLQISRELGITGHNAAPGPNSLLTELTLLFFCKLIGSSSSIPSSRGELKTVPFERDSCNTKIWVLQLNSADEILRYFQTLILSCVHKTSFRCIGQKNHISLYHAVAHPWNGLLSRAKKFI